MEKPKYRIVHQPETKDHIVHDVIPLKNGRPCYDWFMTIYTCKPRPSNAGELYIISKGDLKEDEIVWTEIESPGFSVRHRHHFPW